MQKELNHHLRSLHLVKGVNKTAVSYLEIYDCLKNGVRLPEFRMPYIFYIADGSVRLHTPLGILDYVSGQYSVSTIDMPFDCQVIAQSEYHDLLALSIAFTTDEVFSVLMSIDGDLAQQIANGKLPSVFMERADQNVTECLVRLTALLVDTLSLEFMASHIKREIIFHVLCGSSGSRFLQSIIGTNQNGEIYDINAWIKLNFRESFSVEEIAKQKESFIYGFDRCNMRQIMRRRPRKEQRTRH